MRDIVSKYSSAINGTVISQSGSQNHVGDGIIYRKSADNFLGQLRLLERDLRAAMGQIPPPPMSSLYNDLGENTRTEKKTQIYGVLHDCFLSVPLFRYFVTEQDTARFAILRAIIDTTYGSLTYNAFLDQEKTVPAETLNRLETIRLRGSVAET